MALDGILEDNNFVNIDDELNFNVVYEPTKFNKKKCPSFTFVSDHIFLEYNAIFPPFCFTESDCWPANLGCSTCSNLTVSLWWKFI